MIEIVDKMSAAEIPLEVQWVDIDYMIDQRDFTVDPVKWGSMKNLTEKLHQNGQKFVLILDPAIPAEAGDDYLPATTGKLKKKHFLKLVKINLSKVWNKMCS